MNGSFSISRIFTSCGKLNRLNLKRMEIQISIGLQSSLNEQVLSIF